MSHNPDIRTYRSWYAKLLHLYPKTYYKRFGESMEQTFSDLCYEKAAQKKSLFSFIIQTFAETFLEIIKKNLTFIAMQNITKRLIVWAIVVGLLLMIPIIGMSVSDEVQWDLFDFVFMGGLLYGAALLYELIVRTRPNTTYRVALGMAAVTGVLLLWINAAVGIIGDGPVNMLYLAVVAVGFLGSIIARFQPLGMSYVLFASAVTQALVPVTAWLVWGREISWSPGLAGVFALNAFFVMLFVGSGLLFRQASEQLEIKPRV